MLVLLTLTYIFIPFEKTQIIVLKTATFLITILNRYKTLQILFYLI